MSSVLLVIAPEEFRDEEYAHPKEVLERAGVTVLTASRAPGLCRGKLGMTARADYALSDVDAGGLDAVAFIGGAGASTFFDDPDAHRLALAVAERGGIVGAICIAPSILARAGLLAGRTATSFPSRREDLVAHGATYIEGPVERDGRVITANGPDAAYGFGEAIVHALGETEEPSREE